MSRFYALLGFFAAMHSTYVWFDLIQVNLGLLLINFVCIPKSRYNIAIWQEYVLACLFGLLVAIFMILIAYWLLKKFYVAYVRNVIERKEIDEMLNMVREGLLIVTKRTREKDTSLIYSNRSFKKIVNVADGENYRDDHNRI